MRLVPDGAMHDMQEADLILVSFLLDIERTLQARDEVVDRLKDRCQRGGHMDSEMGRTSQAPFAVFHHRKDHHDSQMLAAQEWIGIHYEPQEIPENRPGGFEKGPNPA